eukprot:132299_1
MSAVELIQLTDNLKNDTSTITIEHDVHDYQQRDRMTKSKICCYIVSEIFIFALISFLSILLMLIFACLSSNISAGTIIIWTLFMFLILQSIVFGFFMICKSHRNNIKKWSIIRGSIFIIEYIILFFVMETLISTFLPTFSIFPNAYSYDALTEGNYTKVYKEYLNMSQTFFDCNLDVSPVKIRDVTQSSMVNNYFDSVGFNAAAYVFVDTIHIVSSDHLIEPDIFIHELVHIWQFNRGTWYGPDGVKQLFDELISPPDISDYYYDLDTARSEGKDFLDFETEQQAEIIEDYYYYMEINSSQYDNHYYYATQYVLQPC